MAMREVLTMPAMSCNSWGRPLPSGAADARHPAYNKPYGGLYLFAQGSEDKLNPYAFQFKDYIHEQKLGTVTWVEAENPAHQNKIGVLFIWKIDQDACRAWWTEHVFDPHKKAHPNAK
jgi:hypothetical protein